MADRHRTPLPMAEVFRDARQVFVQRGLVLWLLSAALLFTSTAGASWLRFHPLVEGADFVAGLGNWLASWLAQALPYSLFIATSAWTVAGVLEGRSPRLGEMLTQGLSLFPPVMAVQVLYLLGTMGASLLLVVPGIIVALMWILASSALVVERLGVVDALKRSRALTKGHRWALLGLLLTFGLIVVAIEWVIFRITTPGLSFIQAAAAPVNAYGVVPLLTALTAPLNCVVSTAIFMRLRSGLRGAADVTAEVFA
jgi:hypothetical protein